MKTLRHATTALALLLTATSLHAAERVRVVEHWTNYR